MPLWVLVMLVIGVCLAYYVIVLADKQENKVVKQMGYLIGVVGIAAIVFSTLVRVYYLYNATCRL